VQNFVVLDQAPTNLTRKVCHAKINPGKNWTDPVKFLAAKTYPPLPKLVLVCPTVRLSVFKSVMEEEENCTTDLVECVFVYLTESKYPEGSDETKKRTIRRKAKMFNIRDGVLYFKKKKKGQVGFDAIMWFLLEYMSLFR
jgi:hypothetical protein